MSKGRTNIEVEDVYVRTIMDRYGVHTKTEAADLALHHLAGQPMTREEALAMRGARAIDELPADRAPDVARSADRLSQSMLVAGRRLVGHGRGRTAYP